MAISIEGNLYDSQADYIREMEGTDSEISSGLLSKRLKSDSHTWKDWFTVGSLKDPAGTKTISVKLSNDKATLLELACQVCDLTVSEVMESSARNLILNTIHILKDYDTDSTVDPRELERAFLAAWKVTPGSVIRKHLDEVA